MSEDIVFDHRIFYKENAESDVQLESSEFDEDAVIEESYLYALLSVFTLIALATLVWSFVR
jgi:hypothetical protein